MLGRLVGAFQRRRDVSLLSDILYSSFPELNHEVKRSVFRPYSVRIGTEMLDDVYARFVLERKRYDNSGVVDDFPAKHDAQLLLSGPGTLHMVFEHGAPLVVRESVPLIARRYVRGMHEKGRIVSSVRKPRNPTGIKPVFADSRVYRRKLPG